MCDAANCVEVEHYGPGHRLDQAGSEILVDLVLDLVVDLGILDLGLIVETEVLTGGAVPALPGRSDDDGHPTPRVAGRLLGQVTKPARSLARVPSTRVKTMPNCNARVDGAG